MFFVVFRRFDEYVAKSAVSVRALARKMREEDRNLLVIFSKSGGRFWVLRRVELFNSFSAQERARLAHDPFALRDWCESV